MSAVEKFSHVRHTLERSKHNKNIYMCSHPRCSFYQKREFLIGKEVECSSCHNPFILSWQQLRNKKPVCEFCSKSPKAKALRQARDEAFKLLNELPDEVKQELLDKTLE